MHRHAASVSLSSSFASRFAGPVLLCIGAMLLAMPQGARAAEGLSGSGFQTGWQARVVGAEKAVLGEAGLGADSLSLFGDYYFASPSLVSAEALRGGFRATGGFFVGPRSGLGLAAPAGWPRASSSASSRGVGLALPSLGRSSYATGEGAETTSVPYVGVGYSGLKSLRATGGGWAFSADLGVMALQPRSAVRLGQQPVGETLRELQFSPLLQVGASYTF